MRAYVSLFLFRLGSFATKVPSGFFGVSTANEVTHGINGAGLTAIVTGATSGICIETSQTLALRGVHVVNISCPRNNAGVMDMPFTLLQDNIELQFATNHFNQRTVKGLDAHMSYGTVRWTGSRAYLLLICLLATLDLSCVVDLNLY